MKILKKHIFLILLILVSPALMRCASDNQAIAVLNMPDNNITAGDGGTYFPNADGSTDVCETDADGNCIDEASNTDVVSLSVKEIDFGISEQDNIECENISIPGGLSYAAEIDKSATSINSDSGNYEFALLDSSGNYSQSRVEGSGTVSVCYLREEICYQGYSGGCNSHTGQVKIVLNADSGSSSAYAYIIPLSGQTLDKLFTITSPTEEQVFDIRDGHNDGLDETEGDLFITATGTVNLNLSSIFTSGTSTSIVIDAEGVKYKVTYDTSGNFSQKIALPKTPGIYSVEFSIETIKGTISNTITVIIAGPPTLEIELRDSAGNLVDTADPTQAPNLIIGFKVTNLSYSGSDETQMPVTIYDIQMNGAPLSDNITNGIVVPEETMMWHTPDQSWCFAADGDSNRDYEGFSTEITYCIPLTDITNLQTGLNKISAHAKNDLGDSYAEITPIFDNLKPVITITSPHENELLSSTTTKLHITGSVSNFAPVDVLSLGTVPEATESNIGSYCQPTSDDDTACPASGLKLWVNVASVDANYPIYIYPKLSDDYNSNTISANNDALLQNDSTRSNCYTTSNDETLFEGDSENTEVDASGNIVTTVADGTTSSTVYTTSTTGVVTVSTTTAGATTDESMVTLAEGDNITSEVTANTEDGISSTVDDGNTDITVTTTTDAETGAITQTTKQTVCNVPTGEFDLTIEVPSSSTHATLNLYSNIIELQATSVSNHRSIKVVSFQMGETSSQSTNGSGASHSKNYTAHLGIPEEECGSDEDSCTMRAPIMINLSEGFLNRSSTEGKHVIEVLEYMLNKNLKLTDFINGWPLPTNEDGKVDLLTKYKEQYKIDMGADEAENFISLSDPIDDTERQKFFYQGLHKASMAEKALALQNYRLWEILNNQCDENKNQLCFFEQFGDPAKDFNVAQDACGNTITTAFVPLKDIPHIQEAVFPGSSWLAPIAPEWPEIANTDLEFDDWVEGKWHIDSIDLKDNGKIDIDICLIPADVSIEDCDDDVSIAKTPAIWGHFVSYNLIEGGILGQMPMAGLNLGVDDATMPLIWSIGKLHLRLTDVLSLKHKVPDDGLLWADGTKDWTNYFDIDQDKIVSGDINVVDVAETEATNSITFEPFYNCRQYYIDSWKYFKGKYGLPVPSTLPDEMIPVGCNDGSTESNLANYPFIIERNSVTGTDLVNKLSREGEDSFLLALIWKGVQDTFKKIVGCADTEMVRPMIDSAKFPYPNWVWNEDPDLLTTTYDWNDFSFAANLNQADLNIFEGGVTLRLPLSASVEKVINFVNRESTFLVPLTNTSSRNLGGTTYTQANTTGYLVRSNDNGNLDNYPLVSTNPTNSVFAGASFNLEAFVNSIAYLVFKRGPASLLDDFDINDVEVNNNWSLGVDKVVLGRFDICNFAGLLSSDLPPDILFVSVQSMFDSGTLHFDVVMDPDYPPTLSINSMDVTSSTSTDSTGTAAEIQLGINNLQVVVKELTPHTEDGAAVAGIYDDPATNPEKFRVRLDGVLTIKMVYFKELGKINIFIEGFEKQNIHLSVPTGHSGTSYDDVNIVTDLQSIFVTLFNKFQQEFDPSSSADARISITLNGTDGTISAIGLNDIQVEADIDAADNTPCGDDVAEYYNEKSWKISPVIPDTDGILNSINPFINTDDSSDNDSDDDSENTDNPAIADLSLAPLDNAALFSDECGGALEVHVEDGKLVPGSSNPIEDALCDLGIKDVEITPSMSYSDGYIHLSADLVIKLEEWFENQL